MAPNLNLGVTDPISLANPSETDEQLSKSLEEFLEQSGCYETENGAQLRIDVLSDLSRIFKQWIKQVTARQANFPDSYVDKVEGKLYTFGSYRLGVNGKNADIDVLAVAPKHIERIDFFTGFADILSRNDKVSEIIVASGAYVPVIKLVYSGVEIDLTFARLNLMTISPDTDLKNINILKNLSEKCAVSLNGCRVTDEILNLVPKHSTFRLTLRAMKHWAKLRGIYGNKFGLFAGVSLAMLVARVCQLYPNAASSTLIKKFFLLYSQWQWPKPIILKEMVDHRLNFTVWNPTQNSSDKFHLMPIITPAYPQMNSTYNVYTSTRAQITKEFVRGNEIIETSLNHSVWKNLFVEHSFFSDYKHFIVIGIAGSEGKAFENWEAIVSSKIRYLAVKLEKNSSIEFVVPCADAFSIKDPSIYFNANDFNNKAEIKEVNDDTNKENETKTSSINIFDNPEKFASKQFFIGFTVIKPVTSQINLTICIEEFLLLLSRSKMQLDLSEDEISSIVVKIKYSKKNGINNYLHDNDFSTFSKHKQTITDSKSSPSKKPKLEISND